MGTRNGSSLNRGRTCTCSMPHGLSLSVMLIPGRVLPWLYDEPDANVEVEGEVAGRVSVEVDGPEESDGASTGLRPANVPSRCISLVTSLASYVRPAEGLEGDVVTLFTIVLEEFTEVMLLAISLPVVGVSDIE